MSMTPELGAAIVGFILALTTLVKQITDNSKRDHSSQKKDHAENERFAVLENRVKNLEEEGFKNDHRFDRIDDELKSINTKLSEMTGMLKVMTTGGKEN